MLATIVSATALLGAGAGADRAGAAPADDPPSEGYVLVQYDLPEQRQLAPDPTASRSLEAQGLYKLPVPEGMTRDAYLTQLRANPFVLSAEPNVTVHAADLPNDAYYDSQQASYMQLIGAPTAWGIQNESPGILVAVLDTGIDLDHPEFAGRIYENTAEVAGNGIDDDGNGCVDDRYGCRIVELTTANRDACGYGAQSSLKTGDVRDDHDYLGSSGHGTFVAGVLGAAGNNGIGMAGASWNAKILPVKVLDCTSDGKMADIAEGIRYAVRMGAKIINISLTSEPGQQGADSPLLRTVVREAEAAGVIIVAAAGNNSTFASPVGPGYPAAYTEFQNVIAVGASTQSGTAAPYSNPGPAVDIAAPGDGIVGTRRTDLGFPAPYGTWQGTSFATPLVAGLFALIEARNPALSMAEYIAAVKDGATPAPAAPHGQNWAGAGIVNFGRALNRIPLTLTGAALHDWKDVAAGTIVRAFVGGQECGVATTGLPGTGPAGAAIFEMKVRADGQQDGCGAPGRPITLTIDGATAQPILTWPAQNSQNVLRTRNVSSVSPEPGSVVVQTLNGAWSNIAQLDASGPLPGVLTDLSTPWSSLLHWDTEKEFLGVKGAYRHFFRDVPTYVNDLDSVQRYEAYWIDGAAANVASLNPNPAPGRTIQLGTGWNNFVWTGSAAEVGPALAQIAGKYTAVLQYDNAAAAWLTYIPGQSRYLQGFNGLFKFKVYWIYAKEPVSLTMP